MGAPSRRDQGPVRRFAAVLLSVLLPLQAAWGAPAEGLRDAVSALGWTPSEDAKPVETPVAVESPLPLRPAQAAYDELAALLSDQKSKSAALNAAGRAAAAVAPEAGRVEAGRWVARWTPAAKPPSRAAVLAALPELARALGLKDPLDPAIDAENRANAARRLKGVVLLEFGFAAASALPVVPGAIPARAAGDPLDELKRLREEAAERERLGQSGDLGGGNADRERVALLDRLLERYDSLLGPAGNGPMGADDAREARWQEVEALRRMFADGDPLARSEQPGPRADLAGTPIERDLDARARRVEELKARLQAELAARDAAEAMLSAADRARAGSLRDRRDGRDMLEFRKNHARLAMVMDLSYSLNILNSADAALGKMQALLDDKVKDIEKRRGENAGNGASAGGLAGHGDEWRAEAEAQAAADRKNRDDFASLSTRTRDLADRVEGFRVGVAALLAAIDARDRGRSANAVAEYDRRLALLPSLVTALQTGSTNPDGISSLSLSYLEAKSREVSGHRAKLAGADARIAQTPLEFAGVLIPLVPGVPDEILDNPNQAQVLALLARRKDYWRLQRDDHQKLLDAVNRSLDPGLTATVEDDFGAARPESLAVWKSQQEALDARLATASERVATAADALSARIEAASGGSLPRLAGRTPEELRDLLPDFMDRLDALRFPDTVEGFDAKTLKIELSRRVPELADLTVGRLEARATVKALEKPLTVVLPRAKAAFLLSSGAMQAVITDADADEAWVRAGAPGGQGQAIIDRKRALISATLAPMLADLQDLIDNTLIPFQRDRIQQSDPAAGGDGYAMLYTEKKKLYLRIKEGVEKTLPWALASNGALAYDAGAAAAGIGELRADYEEYRVLVRDYKDQMRRRKDPNNAEMEDLYGENVPFSLVKRAAVYREERRARALRLNARAVEFNSALADLDALTLGKHNLARLKLPADLDESPASAAKLQAIADGRVLQNSASELKAIADAAQAAGGGSDLSVGGSGGGIPTGNQPPVDVSTNQRIALLCLEAIKRLVPTTATAAAGDSYAQSLARFLFADALIKSSEDYLRDRIPIFEAFLDRAAIALNEAFADLDADQAWTGGPLTGGAGVLDRKVAIYRRIAGVAAEGADLFGQKMQWSQEGVETAGKVEDYYETIGEVYNSGNEALDAELSAAREFQAAVNKSRADIQKQRATVVGWLAQLNDPRESALARVAQNLSTIQEKTRAVLESNVAARRAQRERDRASKTVEETLRALAAESDGLARALESAGGLTRLSPEVAARAEGASRRGGAWAASGPRGPQTLAIPKSDFERFLSQLFGAIATDASGRDLESLRQSILKDPTALAGILPGAQVIQVGEGTDGFYLVYQSEFSTPGGLETAQQVTMGNVLQLWGQNVSVIGHRFASPPSEGNAPFGDQGVTVRVESLDSDHAVNYLDVTFHKFVQDIPADLTTGGQAREARMMIFDDFALMLADGKVYFGAAGFADVAASGAKDKPQYYGANLKAEVKFTEIVSLKAEETALLATDPRKFFQTVNLDFTGYDPALDQTFAIEGSGERKTYRRDKLGLGFDLGKALGQTESFTMDLYYTKVASTDDMSQQALGASLLKGFAFDLGGRKVNTTVGGGAEFGENQNAFTGRVGFELPDMGLAFNAQGKVIGTGSAYFAEVRKKLGSNSDLSVSYGSRYIGLNDRLTIAMESSYTLGELWRAVTGRAAEDLRGGKTLAEFDKGLAEFLVRDDPRNPALGELARVFDADVGRSLLTLEMGRLSREVAELQRAGAFLDNTRQRAMIGFVSHPVGPGTAEQTTGGGFQAGTQTEMTLTRTQRALIESKTVGLFTTGLRLETRLVELAKSWQQAVADLARARWRKQIALFMAMNSDDPVLRAEGEALVIAAGDEVRQAGLRYASLTGRGPDEPLPFDGVNPQDLERLMAMLAQSLSRNDRLGALVARARTDLKLPPESFNVLDWIPWIERMTFWVGAQLSDLMSSQALGAGLTVTLPVYDPTTGRADAALRLQDQAALREMAGELKQTRLRARSERLAAKAWEARAAEAATTSRRAADEVADAIRAYRNALIDAPTLRAIFRRWRDAVDESLNARVQADLQAAWAVLDDQRDRESPKDESRVEPTSVSGAFDQAQNHSASWEAALLRSQAARELLEAADRRVRGVDLDLSLGLNITAAGVALIPAFGITGLAVMPVLGVDLAPEELRELDVERRSGEENLYLRLRDKAAGDLAAATAGALIRTSYDARMLALYRDEILPGLEAAQDGSSAKAAELARARGEYAALDARRRDGASAANHLLGRPLNSRMAFAPTPEAALVGLAERERALDPVSAAREVLQSRLRVARAVEEQVDKGLKVERLRIDPISLVGRSLGRLVSALSGDGLSSPELSAVARARVLDAERALEAFDASVPVVRARLDSELALTLRRRAALEGRADASSRLAALELDRSADLLRAQILAWGGSTSRKAGGAWPSSWAELSERLREAVLRATPPEDAGGYEAVLRAEPGLDARGSFRWYDHRQTLGGDPVGQKWVEGWLEARLRSPSTPPEALAALAELREKAADERRRATVAAAGARADMALARLRLDAGLMRWSEGVGLGEAARARVVGHLAEAAALLGLPADARPEALLDLVPAEADGDLAAAAARALADAETLDFEVLRRVIFQDGLPEELSATRDGLPQLRADLIAEKMSSRGFTPVAAIGLFRGSWVQGAFLEAPDPERVRDGLVAVLDDALRRELEEQDRLKSLALQLHSLMASVAEKTRLAAAQRLRSQVARRSAAGAVERVRLRLSPPSELVAAQAEAERAQAAFLETALALRLDFSRLAAELTALGISPAPAARLARAGAATDALEPSERAPRERLLAYWADRLLDPEFAGKSDALLAGAPESLRAELRVLAERYRIAKRDAAAVRGNEAFSAGERLELLVRVDLQGRRRLIEQALQRVMNELGAQDPARSESWAGLMDFLRRDLEAQGSAEGAVLAGKDAVRAELRSAFFGASTPPAALRVAVERLEALQSGVDQARRTAAAAWLARKGGAQDHLLKDKALDAYVAALDAFDAEMERALSLPDASRDAGWARVLDGMYGVRESLRRRRDRLEYGRGLLTIDASIELGESRLRALRYDPSETREIGPASENLAFLRDLRRRWTGKTDALPALIALKGSAGTTWATGAELARAKTAGRVIELDGKKWLMPERWDGRAPADETAALANGGALVVEGDDATRERLRALKDAREGAAREAALAKALERSEVALVDANGSGLSGLMTLAELRRLESQGRALWFEASSDKRTGLRPAVPALAAARRDPATLVLMIRADGAAPDVERHASLEALLASRDAASFRRARVGAAGLEALAREAAAEALAARRAGWLKLKLSAFAFALDAAGTPAAVYMDEKELQEAAKRAADPKDPTHEWTFHRVSALSLGLASDGSVVVAKLGTRVISLGNEPVARWLVEQPLALEVDASGRVAKAFTGKDELERAAKTWWVEDAEGRVWKNPADESPTVGRIVAFVDPATGLRVALGNAPLTRRLEEARDAQKAARRWAYMPGQWPDMILEIPRGITSVPVELISGRDTRREGYLGRVYARRGAGGATRVYGPIGRVLRAVDLLGFLPDPVDMYFDPSQFPEVSDPSKAPSPGEWLHEHDPRTVDGRRRVIYGAGELNREERWAKEDREAERDAILSAFRGGVRRETVETVRGREGTYAEPGVATATGRSAVEAELLELGARAGFDGRASVSADPRRGAVDRVTVGVQITLGAESHEERVKVYAEALKRLREANSPSIPDAEIATAEAELSAALAARRAAAEAFDAVSPKPSLPGFPAAPKLFFALR